MYHKRFFMYIVLFILSIVIPATICDINNYPLGGLIVFTSFAFVFVMYKIDKISSCDLYKLRLRKQFPVLIESKQFNEAEKFLKRNSKYCFGVYYMYTLSFSEINSDAYEGYPKVFKIRDDAYIELYIKSKQYDKALKYINSKRDFVKNKYYYELFLLELYFNLNTKTLINLRESKNYSNEIKQRSFIIYKQKQLKEDLNIQNLTELEIDVLNK